MLCLSLFSDMSPNALFEYAGDRDVVDEENVKDIEIHEQEIKKTYALI